MRCLVVKRDDYIITTSSFESVVELMVVVCFVQDNTVEMAGVLECRHDCARVV